MRLWAPDDPTQIAETVAIDIGPRETNQVDTFRLLLATPRGLDALDAHDGILAAGALLVMQAYEFDEFWRWLGETVSSCEDKEWFECVANLQRFFDWDYQDIAR